MKIGIVTDSTADIPVELCEQGNIQVVPAILVIDGQNLEDGSGISRREFYERLPGMRVMPTTSAPSVGAFLRVYERLFNQGFEQIISIHTPAALSGIFNAARLAAQNFGERVHVVDSGQLSLGIGFQALTAAESVAEGASLEQVLMRLASIRQRVRLMAMLDTLEYVRRSGRVSWARAGIGALLNLKPFLELKDGAVLRLGEARTRRKGIEHLRGILQSLGPLERLAVLHTNAEADAHPFAEVFAPTLARPPLIVNVTTVIGTHIGPNGLGFAAVPYASL
jgi:DegV family protein with EDD domain